jgi:DNA-binding phage protein
MGKTKTFRRRKTSISKQPKLRKKRTKFIAVMRDDVGITPFNPFEKMSDIKLIGSAIMECFIDNDPEGVMEVIETHLEAINKSKFLKEAEVPRSTMYKLMKMKNPTIKTLAKIIHAAYHASTRQTQGQQ